MNIFVLDYDSEKAAKYHPDRHIVKMPLEAVQLLCSAHTRLGNDAPYNISKGHLSHPCALWVQESADNYVWLLNFARALFKEYTHRYKKRHKSEDVLDWCAENIPNLPQKGLTPFAQAMPEECKNPDVIRAYRKYFIDYKWNPKSFNFKRADFTPDWYAEGIKTSPQKDLNHKQKKKM
jgi:hypothetical protein